MIAPSNVYWNVSAKDGWVTQDTRTNASGEEYVGVYTMAADVTSVVCSEYGGYGTYTVANIPVWNGVQSGEVVCGGESVASWQLIVVEESPNFPLRTISLNTMSQYFYNINYTVKVNFADASSPTGDISMQWYNLFVDVDSQYRLSGSKSTEPEYWHDESNYRFKTQTRGLYKNGVSINSRDTGSVQGTGSSAKGAIHGHLYEDVRNWNNLPSSGIIYLQEGTNRGISVSTLGMSVDIFAYDIVFDGNGATSGSMDNLTCVYGRGYNLPENQYVKEHYKVGSWNTKPDGSGTTYKNGQYIRNLTATEDKIILYAQYIPDAYKITLDSEQAFINGTRQYYQWYGFGNYSDELCTSTINKIIIPQKKGYSFGGYYTERNGQGTKYVDENGNILSSSTTFTSDTTLYAYWDDRAYKVTLDNQGATTPGTKEYYGKYGVGYYTTSDCTTEILNIEVPTKSHYEFGGYYTEKNGNGQQIIDEEGNILQSFELFHKDVTLYAKWNPATYIISLDSQNATEKGTNVYYEKYGHLNYTIYGIKGETSRIERNYGYTGDAQIFVAPYTGVYDLAVWGASGDKSISKNTQNRSLITGTVALRKGETLYIYVGGQANGEDGGWNGGKEGYYDVVSYRDGRVDITGGSGATDIRRGGIDLSNRIIIASGSGGIMDQYISSGNSKNMTVMADPNEWGLESYFTMYYNNPYNASKFSSSVSTFTLLSASQTASKKYWTFPDGFDTVLNRKDSKTWNVNPWAWGTPGLGKSGYGGGGGLYGGMSMTAEISPPDGSSSWTILGTPTRGSCYIGGVINGTIWKNINGVYAIEGSSSSISYLSAEGNTYNVHSGNGSATISYDVFTEIEELTSTSIVIPQKDGYKFGGYYTKVNGQGTKYVDENGNILSTPTTFTSDTVLYAYWISDTSNTYKIAFNGNGADTGVMPIMTCNFNQLYTLTANAFMKTGYSFAGWSISIDGEVEYADKESISNLANSSGDVVTLYAQWAPGSVSYKVNHYTENLIGDWELHSTDIETGTSGAEITLSNCKKSIVGFTYEKALVGGIETDKAVVSADGSLIVNLYYVRGSYSVSLEKDGGISSVSGAGTYKFEEEVIVNADVSPNYEWANWSGSLTSTDKEYQFYMPASNVTLKANSGIPVYTIYLDEQIATESGTLQYYEKYSVGNFADSGCSTSITKITIPKRTGYKFGGYYTETNGNGTKYIDESGIILATSTTFTQDTVLYAKWNPISYTIKFDSNGGTGTMPDMTCLYGSDYILSANEFIRDKYKFVGWNIKADGSGETYANKSVVSNLCSTDGGSITLYAQWTPNTYIIHFDSNSGTGVMDDMECEFHVDYVLNANQFTKTGYDFVGWSLTPDGEVALADKAIVNNLHSTTGIITLYAKWVPGIVSYQVNHYTESLENSWELHDTDELMGYTEMILKLTDLVKPIEGFTYKNAKVGGIVVSEAVILADGSLVIDLYYTRNSYTIDLDKDGGISSVSGAGTYKYGETVTLDAKVRLGYSWSCWSGTYGTTDKKYVFVMPAEDVMMKANTSPVVYEISLNNQSADSTGTEKFYEKYDADNYVDASCNTKIEIISLPEKIGYTFEGYYTETEGKGMQYIDAAGAILSTPTTFTEDTVLYAYWTPITYIIQFEGNGSDGGSMDDMYCKFNQEYSLNENHFTKEQYNFTGWNTKPDGSGTEYQEQALIKNLSSVQNNVITLYAQWKPNTYEVYFDANGGEGTMDSISLFYDMEQALPESLFTKSNEYGPSTFLGWNTDATATAALFEDEACVMNIPGCENGLVTLYAIWDDCPWIVAEDLYYSLYEAQNGLITYDELMSHAIASDKEDGAELLPGIDAEKGTSFTIIDYLPTDFTQFTASGSVTETYQVIDSAGNKFKQMITVHVVDTTPVEILPDGTTRFINEKYYNETYENGGLEADSIWKTDPEFVAVIQEAFDNFKNDTPIMSFSFTYEEILEMKEFIRVNGIGNSKNPDALQQFYDRFMVPNMVN